MTGRLRPWSAIDELQHRVMDDLYEHDERLALLPTGFGKTLCSMTVGEELRTAGVVKRPLVLAPLRVAQNTWPQERFEWEHLQHVEMVQWGTKPDEWADSLWKESRVLWGSRQYYESRIVSVVDTIKRREMEDIINDLITRERKINKQIRATVPPDGWHVASFENSDWLLDLYKPGESPFDMIVIDEVGKIGRNPKSSRYKELKKHVPSFKVRIGLNATPAPEGAEDLFGQVQLIAGKRIWGGSFYQWRQKFFMPVDYHGHSWRLQRGAFEELMTDLNTIAVRVPPEALKYQKSITHRQIPVDLPPKARAAYDDMAKQMAVEIEPGMDLVALSEAAASQKLRQIVQGYLYETTADGQRIVHHMHDEKTNALADLIDSMGREPLLVAYQFDEDLENIRKVFKGVPWLGKNTSSAKASEYMERWNKRELPVLAIHPASVSHGVNLQYGGHNICWLALPWGLDPYSQSNDRIDRRGQEHKCYGHHIVVRNSKDDQVSEALIDKHDEQARIIAAIRSIS